MAIVELQREPAEHWMCHGVKDQYFEVSILKKVMCEDYEMRDVQKYFADKTIHQAECAGNKVVSLYSDIVVAIGAFFFNTDYEKVPADGYYKFVRCDCNGWAFVEHTADLGDLDKHSFLANFDFYGEIEETLPRDLVIPDYDTAPVVYPCK